MKIISKKINYAKHEYVHEYEPSPIIELATTMTIVQANLHARTMVMILVAYSKNQNRSFEPALTKKTHENHMCFTCDSHVFTCDFHVLPCDSHVISCDSHVTFIMYHVIHM